MSPCGWSGVMSSRRVFGVDPARTRARGRRRRPRSRRRRRAARRRTRPRVRATRSARSLGVVARSACPATQTCTPSIATSIGSGAASGDAPCPTAWTIRPQFGSPPCSAVFTSGELAIARAARSTLAACPPRTTTRPIRSRPRRRGRSRAPAGAAARRAPRRTRSSSSDSGSTRTPRRAARLQDRGVVRRELAVDGDAVEERLTQTAEQQVGRLGAAARRRSATKQSIVAKLGGSSPRPWPARVRRTVPPGSVDLERRALLEPVGRHDRLARGRPSPSARSSRARRARGP